MMTMEKERRELDKGMGEGAMVLDLLEFSWRKKPWAAGIMFGALAIGLLSAFLMKPMYSAEAIISPKEPQKGLSASGILSQLGAVSGMSQALGGAGTNLNKMELMLEGVEMSTSVILENDLLPVLYPDQWDAERHAWKNPGTPPSLRKAAERMRKSILTVTSNPRQNTITVATAFRDSVMAKRLVDFFIASLNKKIRDDIISESNSNRAYLDSQIAATTDPMLRQKLQELIGMEIEKTMLVSTRSVEVLIPPEVPIERLRPKRKAIMIAAFGLGLSACFAFSLLGFFLQRNADFLKSRLRKDFRHRGAPEGVTK